MSIFRVKNSKIRTNRAYIVSLYRVPVPSVLGPVNTLKELKSDEDFSN